jgi:hexokinase
LISSVYPVISVCRYVCEAVSRRASMMASAGITALLKKMDYKDVVIAIDGSVFRYINQLNH